MSEPPVVLRDLEGRYWMGGKDWTKQPTLAWRWDNVSCAARAMGIAAARGDQPCQGEYEILFQHSRNKFSRWTFYMNYPGPMVLEPKENE